MPAGPALPGPDPPQAVDAEVTWPPRLWVDAEQLGPGPPVRIDVEELDPETGLPVEERLAFRPRAAQTDAQPPEHVDAR